MGIARHHALLFFGCLISMALLLFPPSSQMHLLLRDSRWTQYTHREADRQWNRNRHNVEAAVTLLEALRAQGHTRQAIHIAQQALLRHPGHSRLEQILLSLFNESYDFESLARLHQDLWDQGRATPDSVDFLESYYNERQTWAPLGRLLESRYAQHRRGDKLPWELIAFHERQRNLPRLQALFTERLLTHPRDEDALAGLIQVYQQLDEHEALVSLYERFLLTSPDHLDTINNLIALYEDEGLPARSELYARRSQLNPSNVDYGLAYIDVLRRSGDKHLAQRILFRLSNQPDPTVQQLSSMAYIAADEQWNDMAMVLVLRAAQTLTPAAPWWEEAGRLTLKNGNDHDARAYYEKAYAENPQQGDVARVLAEMHFRGGDPEKAAEFWNVWLAARPDDRAARLMIGDTLSVYNRGHARTVYDQGLAIPRKTGNPEDTLAYATLLTRTGRTKEAFAEMKSLEKQGRLFTTEQWGDLAYLAIQANELKTANTYLTKAEKTAPSDRTAALRAQLYLAENRPVEALPLLEQLTRKNPTDADLKGDLAWTYAQLKNWGQAEILYRELRATRREQEAERMLQQITELHHPRIEAETHARLGPGSKDEWMSGLTYQSSMMNGKGLFAAARAHFLSRRQAQNNRFIGDWVQHYSAGGKIERRRWQMEASLNGYFGRKADALSPEGELRYQSGGTLLSLSGFWHQPLLDPSEALEARGTNDLVRAETSQRWGAWEARAAGFRRGFQVDGSKNPFTGSDSLGHESGTELGIVRILSDQAPFASMGYTFLSSHWNKPFDQASTLIPWLDNQRSHMGTLYVEQRLPHRIWDRVSAGASGGKDFARDTWLMTMAADVSGHLSRLWRWSLGAGWARDSGVVGSGSSTTLRGRLTRFFE